MCRLMSHRHYLNISVDDILNSNQIQISIHFYIWSWIQIQFQNKTQVEIKIEIWNKIQIILHRIQNYLKYLQIKFI